MTDKKLKTEVKPNDDYMGSTLFVTYNNEVIFEMDDSCIEPEDVKFVRDLSYLVTMIEEAYELGLKEGEKNDR